ncbi:hypothetical protein [Methylomonas albis]|nr:hypothetical protein [Methylomonas albis]
MKIRQLRVLAQRYDGLAAKLFLIVAGCSTGEAVRPPLSCYSQYS